MLLWFLLLLSSRDALSTPTAIARTSSAAQLELRITPVELAINAIFQSFLAIRLAFIADIPSYLEKTQSTHVGP